MMAIWDKLKKSTWNSVFHSQTPNDCSVLDLGVYPIQISLWVFRAEPTKVIAFGKLNEDGLDMELNGELLSPNGGITKFKVSCLTALTNKAIIKGAKGEIVVSLPFRSGLGLEIYVIFTEIKNVFYVTSGAKEG